MTYFTYNGRSSSDFGLHIHSIPVQLGAQIPFRSAERM